MQRRQQNFAAIGRSHAIVWGNKRQKPRGNHVGPCLQACKRCDCWIRYQRFSIEQVLRLQMSVLLLLVLVCVCAFKIFTYTTHVYAKARDFLRCIETQKPGYLKTLKLVGVYRVVGRYGSSAFLICAFLSWRLI